jgi:hypothetical protein
MYDEEKFKTIFQIDKEKHPDSELITYCGKEMPLGKVRSLFENFDEKKYTMVSFWDDMFQYTSLGLLDLVFEMKDIDAPLPVRGFFSRDMVYGKDYITKVLERFHIPKEEVDEIEKTHYEEILRRSPLSHNCKAYFKLRELCSRHLMVFKYPFSIAESFTHRIQESFGGNEFISLELDYSKGKTEEEYLKSLPKAREQYFDIVICQDAASILEYLATHNILGSQVMTPFEHCGLSLELKLVMETYTEGVGPAQAHIFYIKEEI